MDSWIGQNGKFVCKLLHIRVKVNFYSYDAHCKKNQQVFTNKVKLKLRSLCVEYAHYSFSSFYSLSHNQSHFLHFRFFKKYFKDRIIDIAIFFKYIDIYYKVSKGKNYNNFANYKVKHNKCYFIIDNIVERKIVMALEELVKFDKMYTHMYIWLD